MISFPQRVPANQRIAESISLRDLPATILDLVGSAGSLQLPGYSPACHWLATPGPAGPATSPVLSEVNVAPIRPGRYPAGAPAKMCSVLRDQHHYIRNANGREELYDLSKDPAEQINLDEEEDLQPLVESLRCPPDKIH